MPRFGGDFGAQQKEKKLKEQSPRMSEQNKKSAARVAFEVEVDMMINRQGRRNYGPFVLAGNVDRQLWCIETYDGKPGAPDTSLEGQWTGLPLMIRKCDEWLRNNRLPPVIDGPQD